MHAFLQSAHRESALYTCISSTYIYIFLYLKLYVYVYIRVHMYMYTYICMNVCRVKDSPKSQVFSNPSLYRRLCTCVHTNHLGSNHLFSRGLTREMFAKRLLIKPCVCVHICVYIYIYLYVCIYIYMYIRVHVYACVYIYMSVYIYIYVYVYDGYH